MFFLNHNEIYLELDNPSILQFLKATLSKFFLILEVELKSVVKKTKQKLIEELPILLNIIYRVYKERTPINENSFREYILNHFKEHMGVDDLLKIVIDALNISLQNQSVYINT